MRPKQKGRSEMMVAKVLPVFGINSISISTRGEFERKYFIKMKGKPEWNNVTRKPQ